MCKALLLIFATIFIAIVIASHPADTDTAAVEAAQQHDKATKHHYHQQQKQQQAEVQPHEAGVQTTTPKHHGRHIKPPPKLHMDQGHGNRHTKKGRKHINNNHHRNNKNRDNNNSENEQQNNNKKRGDHKPHARNGHIKKHQKGHARKHHKRDVDAKFRRYHY